MPPMRAVPTLLLGLLLALAGCGSPDASAPPSDARSSRDTPEKNYPRLYTLRFVAALNAPDPETAGSMIHWQSYVARDPKLMALTDLLRRRYEKRTKTHALDKPLFKNTEVTSRQLLESKDPNRLLGRIVRERFEKRVAETFTKEKRKSPAELMAFNRDIRSTRASIRMPNGRITEFKLIRRESRYWLVPLW